MNDPIERRRNDVELAMLRKDLEALTEQVTDLSGQVHSLVVAWQTAGYIVGAVKWLAGLATALGVIWASIKGFGR